MNLGEGLSSFTENLTSFKFSYLDLQVKNVILTEGFESIKEKVSPEFEDSKIHLKLRFTDYFLISITYNH